MARMAVMAVAPLAQAAPGILELNATAYAERRSKWAALVSQMNGPLGGVCERDMRESMPACHQEGEMWCWATGVTSLKAYYQGGDCNLECSVVGWCPKPSGQGDFMQQGCSGGPIDCCPLSAHPDCGSDGATYGMLLEAAAHFTGRTHRLYNGPMPKDVLDKTLSAGVPILMLIGPDGSAAHVVSVAGCGSGSYFFHDPETAEGQYEARDYSKLLTPQDGWAWIDTVYADPADSEVDSTTQAPTTIAPVDPTTPEPTTAPVDPTAPPTTVAPVDPTTQEPATAPEEPTTAPVEPTTQEPTTIELLTDVRFHMHTLTVLEQRAEVLGTVTSDNSLGSGNQSAELAYTSAPVWTEQHIEDMVFPVQIESEFGAGFTLQTSEANYSASFSFSEESGAFDSKHTSQPQTVVVDVVATAGECLVAKAMALHGVFGVNYTMFFRSGLTVAGQWIGVVQSEVTVLYAQCSTSTSTSVTTTMDPIVPTTEAETTTSESTTTSAAETTTSSVGPTPTPQRCQACMTVCAPCKECAEGPDGSFAFGSCEKCWHCWDWDDDKLEDADEKMDKDCDALHKKHDWSDDEARCLTNDHQDCRACWDVFGEMSVFV